MKKSARLEQDEQTISFEKERLYIRSVVESDKEEKTICMFSGNISNDGVYRSDTFFELWK